MSHLKKTWVFSCQVANHQLTIIQHQEPTKYASLTHTALSKNSQATKTVSEEVTNCMEQNFPSSQEIRRILWNPKLHYHVHRSRSLFHILSLIKPIHAMPSYFLKTHFNIISDIIRATCLAHFIILYNITPKIYGKKCTA